MPPSAPKKVLKDYFFLFFLLKGGGGGRMGVEGKKVVLIPPPPPFSQTKIKQTFSLLFFFFFWLRPPSPLIRPLADSPLNIFSRVCPPPFCPFGWISPWLQLPLPALKFWNMLFNIINIEATITFIFWQRDWCTSLQVSMVHIILVLQMFK